MIHKINSKAKKYPQPVVLASHDPTSLPHLINTEAEHLLTHQNVKNVLRLNNLLENSEPCSLESDSYTKKEVQGVSSGLREVSFGLSTNAKACSDKTAENFPLRKLPMNLAGRPAGSKVHCDDDEFPFRNAMHLAAHRTRCLIDRTNLF